ncbi:aminotransferase class I/II-fold pyridoxal phosphate-dependent enzyme, partial [Paenibacillus tuaregi]|uniref:aminotransferase class I/II-fold pyridoxal phosphate-dependent enzyme n=1 Tax=Paenibacillus tuaregi TaxID=1816681 RepID=UPI0011DD9C6A
MTKRKLDPEERRPPGDGLISLAEEGLETGLLPDGWREAAYEAWKGEVQEELLSLAGEGVLQAEVTRAISGWFSHGDSPALEDGRGLFVTAGRGRALALLANALLKPGEKVLVETPVSPAAREIFLRNGVEIIGVPCDPDGMLPGECRTLIRKHKPRLIYFTPDGSDTCGISWSSRRRAEMLEVALENKVWTVADRSGGRAPVPGEESYLKGSIYALAGGRGAGARTAELDSMDGHGIHAAWVRADRALVQRLQEARLKLPEQAGHRGLPGVSAALLVRPG